LISRRHLIAATPLLGLAGRAHAADAPIRFTVGPFVALVLIAGRISARLWAALL